MSREKYIDSIVDSLTAKEAAIVLARVHAKSSSLSKSKRLGLYPVDDWNAFTRTKRLEASYWQADEVIFTDDITDFNDFTEDEKRPLLMAFGFFAVGDGSIVNMLAYQMILLNDSLEKQGFYVVQLNNERVHAETYGKMIYTLVRSDREREKIFNAVDSIESIKGMNDYIGRTFMNPKETSFRNAYVCLAITEFLMFTPLFTPVPRPRRSATGRSARRAP